MGKKLTEWVLSYKWLVLLLSIGLVFAIASGAGRLVMSNDYRVFFGEDNPQLQAYEAMQKVFNKSDNVSFIVVPESGDITDPEYLESIQFLTEEAWQVPYSRRVDSITNFQYSYAEEDDLIVEDLVSDPQSMTEAQLKAVGDIALAEPQLLRKIISEKKDVSIVNVTIEMPNVDPAKEVPEVAAFVRAVKDQYLDKYPNNKVYLSGIVMMNVSFNEAGINDTATFLPLMFGVVLLTIGLLLRTITGAITTFFVVVFSIVGGFGFAGWMGFPLTGPMFSAVQMIMTLAVADCIHILSSMFFEMRRGMPKREAIIDSLRVNFQPIFLTSITTAIGFMSMNFSDSPPFHDLGNTVAFGVMLAYVLSMTFFPAILYVLPIKVKVQEEGRSDAMTKLSEFVVAKRNMLLPVSALIMVVFISLLPLNEANDNFVEYFDDSVPFRTSTDFMQEHVSGMALVEIAIYSGEASGVNSPEFLKVSSDFSDWFLQQPEADHIQTITDTMKRLNRNMNGDDPSAYELPSTQEMAAQYMLLYEMSLPYGLDLNNQLDIEKSSTRLIGTLKNLSSVEMLAVEQRIEEWFSLNGNAYEVKIASPSLMFAHIGQRNISSMLLGTFVALILISVLLGIALRSVKFGLISLLPNLAPAGIAFGLWYLIDGEIGLGLSVVAGMTLGIIVDDTVHFLSKYLRARREKNLDTIESVHYAFSNVGRALVVTTFVLVAGFMVLAQSSFKMNSDMGLLTAITILIALIVDFLFLPPLLMHLDRVKEDKKNTSIAGSSVEQKI